MLHNTGFLTLWSNFQLNRMVSEELWIKDKCDNGERRRSETMLRAEATK